MAELSTSFATPPHQRMRYTSPPGVSPSHTHVSNNGVGGGSVPSSALSTSSIDPPSPISPAPSQQSSSSKEFVFPPPYRCTINGWASLIEFVPYSASQPQQMVISSAASNQAQNYSLWRPGAGSSLAHSSSINGESSSMHVAIPFRLLMSPYDMSRVERATPYSRNHGTLSVGSTVGIYTRSLHSRAGGAAFPSSSAILPSDQGTRQRLRSVATSSNTISQSHTDILQQRAAVQRQGYEWQDPQSFSNSFLKGVNENNSTASFGSSAPAFSSSTFLSSRSSSSTSFPTISSSISPPGIGASSYSSLNRTQSSSMQQPSISTYAQQQALSPRVTTRGQGGSNLIFSSPRSIGHAGNALIASSGQIMSSNVSSNRPYSPTSPPYSGSVSPRGATQQQQRRGASGALGGSPFLSPYASSYASRDSRSRASPSRGRWDE